MTDENTENKDPSVWDDMRRLIDELELKANLAGKELSDRWEALKPRLQGMKEKMEAKTAEARAKVAQEVSEIGAEVRRLRDDVVARVKK